MSDRSIFDERQIQNLRRAYEATPPPATAQDAIVNESWQYWFFQYLWQDLESDEVARGLVNIYRVADEWDLDALGRTYIDNRSDITWPNDFVTRINAGRNGEGDASEADLKREFADAAVALLNEHYYPTFLTSVQQACTGAQAVQPVSGAGSGGQQPLPVWLRPAIFIGDTSMPGQRIAIDAFVSAMNVYAAPDLRGDIDSISSQLQADHRAEPTTTLMQWGSSFIGLGGAYVELDQPFIDVVFSAVLRPADMVQENDYRLHLLAQDGQACWYAQCNEVVMLDPGAGDIRFATLRYACSLSAGVSGQGTLGSITRSNRRMRTDALRCSAITPGYKDLFKKAIREVSDKIIEWV